MLSNILYADIVYTASGTMGVIKISDSADVAISSRKNAYSDDLFVSEFYNYEDPGLILIERNSDMTLSGDYAYIFKPDLSLEKFIYEGWLDGIYMTQSVAYSNNGRGLFFSSKLNHSISEISTVSFNSTGLNYIYSGDLSEDFAVKIIASGYALYALSDSKLKLFDGQLKDSTLLTSIDVGPGANDMAIMNNSRLAIAHESGINIYYAGYVWDLVSDDLYGNIKAICYDNAGGLFFIGQEDGADTIWHYTNEMFEEVYTDVTGEYSSLIYDSDKKILVALIGNKLIFINSSSYELVAEFDSSNLGGIPNSIAKVLTSGADNSTKSGCNLNIYFAGLIILLAGLKFKIIRH